MTPDEFEADLNQAIDQNLVGRFESLLHTKNIHLLREILCELMDNGTQTAGTTTSRSFLIHKLCTEKIKLNMLQNIYYFVDDYLDKLLVPMLTLPNEDGFQPIHIAAQHQLIDTITVLQDRGHVDASVIDSKGNNIIHHLLQSMLLQNNAHVMGLSTVLSYNTPPQVNVVNQNGHTPLHLALMLQESTNKLNIVSMLLENKADPLIGEPQTAFHVALHRRCPFEYIQLLVDKAKSSPLLTEHMELYLQETARTVGASHSIQELLLNGWRTNIAPEIEEVIENKDGVLPSQPDVCESPTKKLKVENKRSGSQTRLDSRSPRAKAVSSSSSRIQCVVPKDCPNVEMFNSFLELLRQHIQVNDSKQFGDAVQYFHDALVEYCTGNSSSSCCSSSSSHQYANESSMTDVIIEDSNG